MKNRHRGVAVFEAADLARRAAATETGATGEGKISSDQIGTGLIRKQINLIVS